MSDGLLYNANGEHISDWFWWTPFLLMFGLPIIDGFAKGGFVLAAIIALPMITMLFIQKYYPI